MLQKFTERAIKTVMFAQEESRRLGQPWVGSEQILLGLISVGGNLGRALQVAGLDLASTRVEVEKIVGRENKPVPVELPFSPLARLILELSWDEAKLRKHKRIDAEHILLALIREKEGVAARVLVNMRVDRSKLREATMALLVRSDSDIADDSAQL